MRVKVGDAWFDCKPYSPLAVELTQIDRERIAAMAFGAKLYATFHEDDRSTVEEREKYMTPYAEPRSRDLEGEIAAACLELPST